MRLCSYPECGRKMKDGSGLCMGHYHQRRSGKPLAKLRDVAPRDGSGPRRLLPSENENELLVPLTQGKVAIIDAADADVVGARNWNLKRGTYGRTDYAQSRGVPALGDSARMVRLHQLLWRSWGLSGIPDHKNGNGLDCRRSNLRPSTANENARNTGKRRHNTAGYKGVSRHKASGRFTAQITVEGNVRHLGMFKTPEEAAAVYDLAAIKFFGEFARTNAHECTDPDLVQKLNAIAGGARLKPTMEAA